MGAPLVKGACAAFSVCGGSRAPGDHQVAEQGTTAHRATDGESRSGERSGGSWDTILQCLEEEVQGGTWGRESQPNMTWRDETRNGD